MIKLVDDFLNGITMYRLMLYFLVLLFVIAEVFSIWGLLPLINPGSLVLSAVLLIIVCWVANTVFAEIFEVQTNLESVYISALILVLIMTPARSLEDALFLGLAAIFSQASKYFLVINKKHIFNPAAFGVLASGLLFNHFASWWYGNLYLFPVVLLGGLLIARKIRRLRMVGLFILSTILIPFLQNPFDPSFFQEAVNLIILSSLLFFTFVMFTEPLSSPKKNKFQFIYAILVALLFNIFGTTVLAVSYPLELSLLIGNVFSFIVNGRSRYVLKLKYKKKLSRDIYEFKLKSLKGLSFKAGQYMEWTLPHPNPDSRGLRRFFTIVSSPTEDFIAFTSKFYDKPSSFKQALINMREGEKITASELAGDFTLPKDQSKKLVFIAGGIGVTPYRSIIKYLLDLNQRRDTILLYSNKLASDIVYKDIFDMASRNLGIRTVYVLTDTANVPKGWRGRVGYIDAKVIQEEIPDYKDRIFYLSGPHSMVDAFVDTLKRLGFPSTQIKVDFFPGYV